MSGVVLSAQEISSYSEKMACQHAWIMLRLTTCQNFNLVDGWLDEEGLQRKGRVGNADARLARSRDILRVVIRQIRQNETVFLHPSGFDEQ